MSVTALKALEALKSLSPEQLQQLIDWATNLPEPEPTGKITHVGVALDSSGSMSSVAAETIGAYNAFIDTLNGGHESAGEFTVTLATFGEGMGEAKLKYAKKPLTDLVKLNERTYIPSGNTPMYDGIKLVIDALEPLDKGTDTAFLVNIFTDGYENTSQPGAHEYVARSIKALTAKGNWTFTFIGANVDLNKIARDTNIPWGNIQSYVSTRAGTRAMSGQHVNSTAGYMAARSVGNLSVQDFYAPPVLLTKEEEEKAKNTLLDALNTQLPPVARKPKTPV